MIHIVDPDASPVFPDGLQPMFDGLVAIGGVLSPSILLEAYQKGIFPWTGAPPIPWYSPDPRMVLFPGQVRVTRSLRQALNKGHLEVRYDSRFLQTMRMCATVDRPGQDGTWITPNMVATWVQLHAMGYAHSVEVYQDGEHVGGLYGMAIGRAFFGESMAAKVPNASKIALVDLCHRLEEAGFALIDCQQSTAHLARMGAVDLPRREYLERLAEAVDPPRPWAPPRGPLAPRLTA